MHTASKIASLSIAALISFSAEEKKSIEREENHYRSEHIELFTYHQGVLRGEVHARMKEKVYKVTGLLLQFKAIDRITVAEVIFANIYQILFCFLIFDQNLESVKYMFPTFVDFPHQVKQAKVYFAKKSAVYLKYVTDLEAFMI